MLRSFVSTAMVLAVVGAVSSARAAAVTGDVAAGLFAAGTFADFTIFNTGPLTADPAGATSLSIGGTLDTSGTPVTVTSGALVLTDASGADYLSGTVTGISFTFSDTADDTITLEIVPDTGSALGDFQPLVLAAMVGDFGDSLGEALDLGVAFSDARIELSQVPVPAALPLLASGLGALALWRRRHRRCDLAPGSRGA